MSALPPIMGKSRRFEFCGGLGRNLIGSFYAFVHAGLKISELRGGTNWGTSRAAMYKSHKIICPRPMLLFFFRTGGFDALALTCQRPVSFNQRMDTRRSDAAGTLPDFYEHQLPFVDESVDR